MKQWDFSNAVGLLLTKVAHEHILPLEPFIPNATTIAAIKEGRQGNLLQAKSIKKLKKHYLKEINTVYTCPINDKFCHFKDMIIQSKLTL